MSSYQNKIIDLSCKEELRISVAKISFLSLSLLEGTGEVFGSELKLKKKYFFTSCELVIFTWNSKGCKIRLKGNFQITSYNSSNTMMLEYLKVNMSLDNMRRLAKESIQKKIMLKKKIDIIQTDIDEEFSKILPSIGPRVLIVGSQNSGKTTLCQILTCYAIRSGFNVTLIDIDPSLNMISLPGSISGIFLNRPFKVEVGINLEENTPIVFWYGFERIKKNRRLYMKTVKNLIKAIKTRWLFNKCARSGGCMINSNELEKNDILEITKALDINILIIIEEEKLYDVLKNDNLIKKMQVKVKKLSKTEGAVKRSIMLKRDLKAGIIEKYFFGMKKRFYPSSQKFNIDVNFRQMQKNNLNSFFFPSFMECDENSLKIEAFKLDASLKNMLLAISFSQNAKDCFEKNVAGFVYITDINFHENTFTCLLPCTFIPKVNTIDKQSFWIKGNIECKDIL